MVPLLSYMRIFPREFVVDEKHCRTGRSLNHHLWQLSLSLSGRGSRGLKSWDTVNFQKRQRNRDFKTLSVLSGCSCKNFLLLGFSSTLHFRQSGVAACDNTAVARLPECRDNSVSHTRVLFW